MSEFEFRRLIPLSAATSLVSVGCAGVEVPSAKEERAATITEIAKQVCEGSHGCSPEYFYEDFNSISECSSYYERYIEEYLNYARQAYGRACAEAYLDLFECSVESSTCELDYDDVRESCEDEYEALYDECGYY